MIISLNFIITSLLQNYVRHSAPSQNGKLSEARIGLLYSLLSTTNHSILLRLRPSYFSVEFSIHRSFLASTVHISNLLNVNYSTDLTLRQYWSHIPERPLLRKRILFWVFLLFLSNNSGWLLRFFKLSNLRDFMNQYSKLMCCFPQTAYERLHVPFIVTFKTSFFVH